MFVHIVMFVHSYYSIYDGDNDFCYFYYYHIISSSIFATSIFHCCYCYYLLKYNDCDYSLFFSFHYVCVLMPFSPQDVVIMARS